MELIGTIIGGLIAGLIGLGVHYLETRRMRTNFKNAISVELNLLIIQFRQASGHDDSLDALYKLADFRHSTHVFLSNTDKVGLLEKELCAAIITAYSTVLLWMGQAEAFERETRGKLPEDDVFDRWREYATKSVAGWKSWASNAEGLCRKLGGAPTAPKLAGGDLREPAP